MQGRKTGGRQLGTVNRLTRTCREAIEFACDALGGAERLAQWAAESPENEAAFWRNIYPRLLPSSVNVLALQKLQQQRVLASKEQILQRLEEKAGPQARQLFEDFVAQVKKLEQQQNGVSVGPPLLKMHPSKAS
jgi:hypothetical protein